MHVVGSVKSSNVNDDVSFISVCIDCCDGSSIVLGCNEILDCKYNGDGYFSIDSKIDTFVFDDEDLEEVDESEIFDTIVNGSVFNIELESNNPSGLNLRSLAVKFENGMVCNLSVEETTVNSEM